MNNSLRYGLASMEEERSLQKIYQIWVPNSRMEIFVFGSKFALLPKPHLCMMDSILKKYSLFKCYLSATSSSNNFSAKGVCVLNKLAPLTQKGDAEFRDILRTNLAT